MKQQGGKFTIEVDMDLHGNMLSQEEAIQVALNEAGQLATRTALENFDTDGKPILVKGERLTRMGSKKK